MDRVRKPNISEKFLSIPGIELLLYSSYLVTVQTISLPGAWYSILNFGTFSWEQYPILNG
jgi:hypothetical protein